MKTSGVSSNQPPQSKSEGTSKSGQKEKPQKEFKQVLDDSGTKPGLAKRKAFFPPEKKKLAGERSPMKGLKGTEGKLSLEKFSTLEKHASLEKHDEFSKQAELEKQSELEKRAEVERQAELDQQAELEKALAERAPAESESRIGEKRKRNGEEEVPTTIANPAMTGPSSVQGEIAAQNVQNPGLSIQEMESIVKKVQVGVNEQGLPECRFEIETKNLGSIDLKVSAEKDQIRIEFATQDNNAQQVLEQNLKELQQMLQDRGLTLVETKFSQRDQGESGQQQSSGREGNESSDSSGQTSSGPKRSFSL
jgi:hypothetical protein